MNEDYQNNNMNNPNRGMDNQNNEINNQNQQEVNNSSPTDTTYHRSYIGENDPNMRTYVNEPNYNQANANAQNQANNNYQSNSNYQTNANQSSGQFYANYDPNGGAANRTYYQNSTTANQGYNYNPNQNQHVKTVKPKKEKKPHPKLAFVGKAALFGLIAGAVAVTMMFGYNKISGKDDVATTTITQPSTSSSSTVKTTKGSSTAATSDVATIVENDMPSIVSIKSTFDASASNDYSDFFYWFYGGNQNGNSEPVGSGSGVIISETDKQLMIVTNNHVISDSSYGDATKVQVTFSDDKTVDAVIKGTDSDADLAVLTVNKEDMESSTLDTVKIAVLGDSSEMRVGDQVVAIGNALGYGQSVTTGIVSALDREVQLEDRSMKLLQTDAAINPGNSGGALLNMNGELIGINSVKYASDDVEGMGYAIPMATAEPIINELMNYEAIAEEDSGYLGIYGGDVSSELTSNYGMPEGVWVTKVTEDSPAEKAGIQQRDIIIKFNDREITNMTALQEQIAKKKGGTEVTVTVMRQDESGEYKEHELKVTLGKKSEAPTINKNDNSNDNDTSDNRRPSDDEGSSNNQNPSGEEMDPFQYFFGN
ncbi:MAG: trypsin-like peptidase domain-containing protein [Lachnospiraceae bacterium]|nr:trypsin-like peptidase domain-containing protein [Lachnospiraceae bacterium]